jgi:hypothetical protein
MYYNTTNEKSLELEAARDDANKQDHRVLAVFSAHGIGSPLSPWTVKEIMNTNAPITSIRRSINTLTTKGRLVKTKTKVMGPYGRPCFCWRLNDAKS